MLVQTSYYVIVLSLTGGDNIIGGSEVLTIFLKQKHVLVWHVNRFSGIVANVSDRNAGCSYYLLLLELLTFRTLDILLRFISLSKFKIKTVFLQQFEITTYTMFITFWQWTVHYLINSHHLKRNSISSTKKFIYKLYEELLNNSRLRILGDYEICGKSRTS